jgi:biotin synthase
MRTKIAELCDLILCGSEISGEDAISLSATSGGDLFFLFAEANRIREHFLGNKAYLCSIINAKSGRCPENCAFCAQSSHHSTETPVFPLVDEEKMVSCARDAQANGSTCYGIITSGTGIKKGQELERICRAVQRIRKETDISPSCSLGVIDIDIANTLKNAGVGTYHHNLETSRSFFPNICTTHNYEEDVETVRVAKRSGMRVCCGGIFGMGETAAQRVELALTLRELDVDSVPLNFLNPIKGTPLEGAEHIAPMECLTTIAIFRFILPKVRISVCGGRETNLRDLQSWIFMAGASGTMIGNYLTTAGRPMEQDIRMIRDLGIEVADCCGSKSQKDSVT